MNTAELDNRLRTAAPIGASAVPSIRPATSGPSFGQVLCDRLAEPLSKEPLSTVAARANVKFSGHAQTRLASRRIALSEGDVKRLGQAMTQAAAKGSRDSLMLLDKTAFVVSVANRTVITAVAQDALKDNIFTNIDSAMIL